MVISYTIINVFLTRFIKNDALLIEHMFEKRTKKQRTIIYAFIAFFVTLLIAFMHFIIQGWIIELVLIVAAIEYVCVFYILYLPLKYQRE